MLGHQGRASSGLPKVCLRRRLHLHRLRTKERGVAFWWEVEHRLRRKMLETLLATNVLKDMGKE